MLAYCQAFSAGTTTISGRENVCPGREYIYSPITDRTSFQADRLEVTVVGGIITRYLDQSGAEVANGTSDFTISFENSVGRAGNAGAFYVQWTTTNGTQGSIQANYVRDGIYPYRDRGFLYPYVGLASIPASAMHADASCLRAEAFAFVDPVPGATSYTWANDLGWTVKRTADNGRFYYWDPSSNPTGSGYLTVTAYNGTCMLDAKQRIYIQRFSSPTIIEGPTSVQVRSTGFFNTLDGSNYNWTVPYGWTESERSVSGREIILTAPNYNETTTLSVSYTDMCGNPASASLVISSYGGGGDGTCVICGCPECGFLTAEEEAAAHESFEVYPIQPENSPENRLVKVTAKDKSPFSLKLYNAKGILVRNYPSAKEKVSINTEDLPSGPYHLIIIQKGKTIKQTIMK